MRALKVWVGILIALVLMGRDLAVAQSGMPPNPVVKVQLISEVQAAAPGETFWVAFEQDIFKGWHTYWKYAGDAGAPPRLKWDLPLGFVAGEMKFPTPHRMPEGPLMTFGYEDYALFPVKILVGENVAPGQTVVLRANAEWLVCEEICIPESATIEVPLEILPEGQIENVSSSEKIRAAVNSLPVESPWAVTFEKVEGQLQLYWHAPELVNTISEGVLKSAEFYPNGNLIKNAQEQRLGHGSDGISLSVPLAGSVDVSESISGLIVLEENLDTGPVRRAFNITATPHQLTGGGALDFGTSYVSASKRAGDLSFVIAALFAFLGGIILNIMPCVFPVLFVKALGFVQLAGEQPKVVRSQGLAYTGGVVLSFVALAALLIGLRAGGAEIGWGFQLQSPRVVALLMFLMIAVGLSLSGVFEIGGRWMNVGGRAAGQGGLQGSFFTGVLATIVATPCTAPFMGAAIGFAMLQPSWVAITLFGVLGLGMAFPYLLLSYFPKFADLLPKPGPWMERAKQALAFPMYGTAAWLMWVLTLQVPKNGQLALMIGVVVFALSIWCWGLARGKSGAWPLVARVFGILGFIAVVVMVFNISRSEDPAAGQTGKQVADNLSGLTYETFSKERVSELRQEGRPVFVNFTAAWCISCLANERVAFAKQGVKDAFEEMGIVYLKADWTNRDPKITEALAEFDRAGVPLYLYYAAGLPLSEKPKILPQILTEGIILKEIGAAN